MSELIRQYNLQNVKILDARPPVVIAPTPQPTTENPYSSKISQAVTIDPELYKSALGTPVLTDLQFIGQTWTDQYGVTRTFKTLTFQAVLITVNQSKNIVLTDIQGRDGTVKEYIGMGDYAITINGIIAGPNGHYPKDEVKDLKRMLDANIAVSVVSWYLQNLDVSSIVIKDYEIPQTQGGYSYQNFSVSALSDTPTEIQIFN